MNEECFRIEPWRWYWRG